ncbi:MAG: hypothetical protein V7640_1671, partial [Betaproteobacteria bacterium]
MAIALVIAREMDIYLVSAPVALFLCAIMFSAWFGGVKPGLFAMALSVPIFDYYFVTPIDSLAVDPKEIPRIFVIVLSALFVLLLSAAQKSTRAALEKALVQIRKSQDRLRLVIDTIPGIVWSAAPDGGVEFVNQPWLDYTGHSLAEVRGPGWASAFHAED